MEKILLQIKSNHLYDSLISKLLLKDCEKRICAKNAITIINNILQ